MAGHNQGTCVERTGTPRSSMYQLAGTRSAELAIKPMFDESWFDMLRKRWVLRLGLLRTKSGRADSSPTICMSCSDKITISPVIGVQTLHVSTILARLSLKPPDGVITYIQCKRAERYQNAKKTLRDPKVPSWAGFNPALDRKASI
ncbi:hypothetical protein F5887DRAFT_200064 [Amanita rubescens]|nr:hypothetical protein F5887DRAFT_200064 [Amanita rubescens]